MRSLVNNIGLIEKMVFPKGIHLHKFPRIHFMFLKEETILTITKNLYR